MCSLTRCKPLDQTVLFWRIWWGLRQDFVSSAAAWSSPCALHLPRGGRRSFLMSKLWVLPCKWLHCKQSSLFAEWRHLQAQVFCQAFIWKRRVCSKGHEKPKQIGSLSKVTQGSLHVYRRSKEKMKGRKEHSFKVNFIVQWCKKDYSWSTNFQFIKKCILERGWHESFLL